MNLRTLIENPPELKAVIENIFAQKITEKVKKAQEKVLTAMLNKKNKDK